MHLEILVWLADIWELNSIAQNEKLIKISTRIPCEIINHQK